MDIFSGRSGRKFWKILFGPNGSQAIVFRRTPDVFVDPASQRSALRIEFASLLVTRYWSAMAPQFGSLFADLPGALHEEKLDEICRATGFRVERIVSTGQASPPGFWYDQGWDEWVLVIQGAASVSLKDPEETFELLPGDWLFLPARRRHRVLRTTADPPTIWLAVHSIVRH